MKTIENWIAAAAIVAAFLGAAAMLEGPSDTDIERATAADLADAKLAAQRFERNYRACKRALGPSADLVQIERTGDYVCREMAVEPTPAEVLHRYADLSGGKL